MQSISLLNPPIIICKPFYLSHCRTQSVNIQ